MALVNLFDTSFTVRWYFTVKEVRLHSERGKATVAGVVGIVVAMPRRSMGITAHVMSRVRPPCLEAQLRDGGSGEAVFAPEPKRGRARRYLRLRPRGRSS